LICVCNSQFAIGICYATTAVISVVTFRWLAYTPQTWLNLGYWLPIFWDVFLALRDSRDCALRDVEPNTTINFRRMSSPSRAKQIHWWTTVQAALGVGVCAQRERESAIPGKFWYFCASAVFSFCARVVTPQHDSHSRRPRHYGHLTRTRNWLSWVDHRVGSLERNTNVKLNRSRQSDSTPDHWSFPSDGSFQCTMGNLPPFFWPKPI